MFPDAKCVLVALQKSYISVEWWSLYSIFLVFVIFFIVAVGPADIVVFDFNPMTS